MYTETIKTAMMFFPFIALLISVPFILREYHNYGSISFMRFLIIYSFAFYLLCAYFLIILPLPRISDVASLDIPRTQLIPFKFIYDLVFDTSFNIKKLMNLSSFYVPLFNILLTIPFGMYLRYFFKYDFKKTILASFLLSMFFELTQLSGLYFIYPRNYRLFDVDDLILNTFGGICGYIIFRPFNNILPKREEIDSKALEKGKNVSSFRKSTAFIFDLVLCGIFSTIIYLITRNSGYSFIVSIIIYYFIVPLFMSGQTLADKYLNIKVVDYNNNYNVFRTMYRRLLFIIIYLVMPIVLVKYLDVFLSLICFIITLIYTFISIFKYIFTKKVLAFEYISKTKFISTIK